MQVNLTASEKKKLIDAIKNDPMMSALMKADYSQIDTWVETNVTTINMAQEVFKRLIKSVKYLLYNLIKESEH